MLSKSAQLLVGLTLAGCACPWKRADQSVKGFKIGACDWTLEKQIDPGCFEFAHTLGLDGVQLSLNSLDKQVHLQDPKIRKVYLDAARRYGMEIPSIAIGELNNVPVKGNDPRAEQWISECIDVCTAMDARVILVPFFVDGVLKGDAEGTKVVVEKFKRLAPKAEKAGVYLAIESTLSAEEHMDIIDHVGSPMIKVYYDVSNSTRNGYDIFKEIPILGDNIIEFHAKDYAGLYGKGAIDFVKVRQVIDDIGYRGWLVSEGGRMTLGLEESMRYNVHYLRQVFPPSPNA
jgi:sugar phosphate isomerase/epimerase